MVSSIRRLALMGITAFIAMALALGYWQALRAPELVKRDDNPRLVLAEQAVLRGTIFDRNGIPLAITRPDQEQLVRYYPEPLAAPLVGYYSLRYGVSGAEEIFDAQLRGIAGKSVAQLWQDDLLHKPRVGQDITLTLDINWQRAAFQAMENHTGTLLVADLRTGEILAMVSQPAFDPNTLDKEWEKLRVDPSAPLLNRATQGQYQPGSLFLTIVMETLLRQGVVALTDTVKMPAVPVLVGNTVLGCATPPDTPQKATWAQVYAAGCPSPFADMAEHVAISDLRESVHRWRLDVPVDIQLARGQAITHTLADLKDMVLGQSVFTLAPLQALHILLVLANDGRFTPITVAASGATLSQQPQLIRAIDATALRNTWKKKCNLSGLTSLAASGAETLVWYMGIGEATNNLHYAIIVLLENQRDASIAWSIACQLVNSSQ